MVAGGDSKQHDPLSAVLEGSAGYVGNHPPLDRLQKPGPLSRDILLKELQGQERQSHRLLLTAPLVLPGMQDPAQANFASSPSQDSRCAGPSSPN